MKRIKITWPYVLKTLQVLLIVFTVYIMLFTLISVKNFNNVKGNGFLGYKFFVVLSNSMKPEFQAGDVVVVKKVDTNNLKAGDIITFYSSDPQSFIVTHQIIEKSEKDGKEVFITKGTNVNEADSSPVIPGNVIGKYRFAIPKAGHMFSFIKTPLGYITLILTPFLIIIISNGLQFVKVFKQYQVEQETERNSQKEQLEAMSEELKKLKEQLNTGNNG